MTFAVSRRVISHFVSRQGDGTKARAYFTKDNVQVSVDCLYRWRITDPIKAVYEVDDLHKTLMEVVLAEVRSFVGANELNLKTAVGGEFFLTQRRREAENAEKIANLEFYRSDPNNLLFHPLGDVLLQVNLMHSSLYSQDSEHSLRSRPLCVSA